MAGKGRAGTRCQAFLLRTQKAPSQKPGNGPSSESGPTAQPQHPYAEKSIKMVHVLKLFAHLPFENFFLLLWKRCEENT